MGIAVPSHGLSGIQDKAVYGSGAVAKEFFVLHIGSREITGPNISGAPTFDVEKGMESCNATTLKNGWHLKTICLILRANVRCRWKPE
jgi:hypothetical protein